MPGLVMGGPVSQKIQRLWPYLAAHIGYKLKRLKQAVDVNTAPQGNVVIVQESLQNANTFP